MPVQRHAEAVADADDVHPRPLRPCRGQHFADGDHDEPLARRFFGGEIGDGQFLALGHRDYLVPSGTNLPRFLFIRKQNF